MNASEPLQSHVAASEAKQSKRRAKGIILVVDDTPENLRLLSSILTESGYEVRPVPSGRLALKAVEKDQPELILLDINMPEMNGYEVCDRLKADPKLCEIPVIFISALNETMDKVQAFHCGGVDYITKPFQFEEVLARVETHLGLQRSRMEILAKNQELDASYTKLKELESLRDSLTHMIVHDLRSPLSGIMGCLGILATEMAEGLPESHRKFLLIAESSASELMTRVNALLDVSRLEEGAMPLKIETVDIAALAREATVSLSVQCLEFHLVFDLPESAVFAPCDRELIGRVFLNLLHNAVKFAPKNSHIRITIEPGEAAVRVAVHDEGRGIPEAYREKIFEKFKQVESAKGGVRKGSGLGLAFCKLAVEAHGGSIGVDCPAEKGSIFWFLIPNSFLLT